MAHRAHLLPSDPLPPSLLLLQDPEFVRLCIWPVMSRSGSASGSIIPPFRISVLRRQEERGRAVVEYALDREQRVVAKLYLDHGEGELVASTHRALWQRGFGSESSHRVPEPVAYLADLGVLLMRPVTGERLKELELRGGDALLDGIRRAAQWLAALHESPVRLGRDDDVDERTARLAVRAASAAACSPRLGEALRRYLDELTRRRPVDGRSTVQTHGRYHAGHVYLGAGHVTVIDLDRAAVAHPGKDIGEFLHRMRWQAARSGASAGTMDALSDTFVHGYLAARPGELAGLAYYWSYSILSTLISRACRERRDRTRWNGRVAFLSDEFENVPRRVAAWQSDSA